MRYEITGRVPRKGNRRGRIEIEADTAEEAVAKARRRGLHPDSITEMEEKPSLSEPAIQEPDSEPQPEPEPEASPFEVDDSQDGDMWEDVLGDAVPAAPPRRRECASPYSRPMRWNTPLVLRGSRSNRFWLLNFLVTFGYLICIAVFALSVIVGVAAWFLLEDAKVGWVRLASVVGYLASTLLFVIPVLIYIQMLDCFLAIEDNTRKSSEQVATRGMSFSDDS